MYQIPGQCFCMEQCGTADLLFLHPNTSCSCSQHLQFTFPSTIQWAMNSMEKHSKFLASPGVQPDPPESTNASPCDKQCYTHFHPDLQTLKAAISPPRPTDINTRAITGDAATFTPLCCISILLCI